MSKIILIFIILSLIPISFACTTPVIYNHFGVPVNIFGGYLPINGSKYAADQNFIPYNLTVKNMNNEFLYVELTPATNMLNYVYGSSVTVPAKQSSNITLTVYVDGPDKIGGIIVNWACGSSSAEVPAGFTLDIDGRGNMPPMACKNTKSSCGIYPGCQDLTQIDGCYNGYYRIYGCLSNTPKYSQSCTNYCCKSYGGYGSSCQSINGVSTCVVAKGCVDECSFTGTSCLNNSIYSCNLGNDGCYHLSQLQACMSDDICDNGSCVGRSQYAGRVAYVCSKDGCDKPLEQNLISWLQTNNWFVFGKAAANWTSQELNRYDALLCSASMACESSEGSAIYDKHKLEGKPFLEVPNSRYANQAFKFGYVKSPSQALISDEDIVFVEEDMITQPFSSPLQIFSSPSKFAAVASYSLRPAAKDLADAGKRARSTLFKVDQEGNQGRYAYVGWFYSSPPQFLTQSGNDLLNRTFTWAVCGDRCLEGTLINKPPIAIVTISADTAYVNQTVTFNASRSYDPNGDILTYFWSFGDGSNSGWSSSSIATHNYAASANYTVVLTVSDNLLNASVSRQITILPIIKNKVALICGSKTCRDSDEQKIVDWLKTKGYNPVGKPQESWTEAELDSYDFMVCASALGCNLRSKYAPFKKHVFGSKGLLEIPNYHYIRAAYNLNYVSRFSGQKMRETEINLVSVDQITANFSLQLDIYNTIHYVVGIPLKSIEPSSKVLAKLPSRDVATMFIVDASGSKGRYAYVDWIYRSPMADITPQADKLLMNTVRWAQCGNAGKCN